jgi:hypothetical protein
MGATFHAADTISFRGATFCGDMGFRGTISFLVTQFCGSEVQFTTADFSDGRVSFANSTFSDGTVDFSSAGDWSHPPEFDWEGTPPPGAKLPQRQDQSPPLTS